METRPVWAEINLAAIRHNLNEVKKLIGQDKKIMVIVKANGYRHGAYEVGKTCLEEGAERLGVAFLEEALMLRERGLTCPIMVLGWTPPDHYLTALENDIIMSIFDVDEAKILNDIAGKLGRKAQVHLKIDTGMARLGIVAKSENVTKALDIIALKNIEVEGIFTHLAKADEIDKSYSHWQIDRFTHFIEMVEEATKETIALKHVANSAGIIDLPSSHFNMVRPGIMVYGLNPSPDVDLKKVDLQPALSLKGKISRVEKYPPGTSVSYGGAFTTTKEALIATIPIGYADGYTRLLSGKAEVLLNDRRFPVVGRICMDQLMIDITGEDSTLPGDEVTLIGRDKNFSITMDEIAYKLGTINYEIACMISSRVPRKYIY